MPGTGLLGVGIVVVSLGLLVADVPALNTGWFLGAWYGYLLILDQWIRSLQGSAFTDVRRRELLAMMFWSVPYWCIFEAYNLVMDNWYYVFLPRSEIAQGLYAFFAFATVLPACFFHAELVKALGWFEETRSRPFRLGGLGEIALGLFGLACVVLPVIVPRYAFWMVWGATLAIPDLINRRMGRPSLVADLEAGRPARWLRLLVGGLMAGGVWESLNYWARAKWVYTVPGFEELKLFEMPLAGFLGFPLLAVEAFAGYVLLCTLARGGRHWERPDHDQPPVRWRHHWVGFALVVAFSWATERWTLDPAVMARRPLLRELDALDEPQVRALREAWVPSPEWLVRRVSRQGVAEFSRQAGMSAEKVGAAHRQAVLALHKGMGVTMARGLGEIGVPDPAALAMEEPDALHRRLVAWAVASDVRPPTLAQVRVWVRAARFSGGQARR